VVHGDEARVEVVGVDAVPLAQVGHHQKPQRTGDIPSFWVAKIQCSFSEPFIFTSLADIWLESSWLDQLHTSIDGQQKLTRAFKTYPVNASQTSYHNTP